MFICIGNTHKKSTHICIYLHPTVCSSPSLICTELYNYMQIKKKLIHTYPLAELDPNSIIPQYSNGDVWRSQSVCKPCHLSRRKPINLKLEMLNISCSALGHLKSPKSPPKRSFWRFSSSQQTLSHESPFLWQVGASKTKHGVFWMKDMFSKWRTHFRLRNGYELLACPDFLKQKVAYLERTAREPGTERKTFFALASF